jgi:hypothetical protein
MNFDTFHHPDDKLRSELEILENPRRELEHDLLSAQSPEEEEAIRAKIKAFESNHEVSEKIRKLKEDIIL